MSTLGKRKKDILRGTTKSKPIDWREMLEKANLSENNFNYEVVYLIESTHRSWPILDYIKEASKISYQYNVITLEDILNPSVYNDYNGLSEVSFIHEILLLSDTDIQEHFRENTHQTLKFLALLIKINIMLIRERYLQRKLDRTTARETIANEIAKLKTIPGKHGKKGKEGKKDKKSKPGKGPKKGKKGKKEDVMSCGANKEEDILFNRECILEEPRLPIYFLLTSFYEIHLLEELQRIGVNIKYFIEIGNDEPCEEGNVNLTENDEIRLWRMYKFWLKWKDNNYLIPKLLPENTCFLKYLPDFSENSVEKRVYVGIKNILGKMENVKRYHKTYLKRLKLVDVEETNKPLLLKDLKTYNKRLDKIPNECISIPLLLHYLLEELEVQLSNKSSSSDDENEGKPKEIPKKEKPKCKNLKEKLLKEFACRTPIEHSNKKEELSKPIKSFYFSYGNTLDYLLSEVAKPKTLKSCVLQILKLSRPLGVFQYFSKLNEYEIKSNKDILRNWCMAVSGLTEDDIELSLYPFLLDKIDFSCSASGNQIFKNDVEIKLREMLYGEESFDNHYPQIYLKPTYIPKGKSSKGSSSRSDATKSSCDLGQTDDLIYAEEFDTPTMIQVINEAYFQYQYYEFKYLKLFDTILLKFSRNCNEFGLSKQKFSSMTFTKAPFRDFCAYLLPEYLDYFKIEQTQYDKLYGKHGKISLVTLYEEKIFKVEDFIIPGSFKDQALRAQKREQEVGAKGKKGKDKEKKAKDKDKKKGKGKEQKSDKEKGKTEKTKSEKSKTTAKSKQSRYHDLDSQVEKKPVFDFFGYDIDPRYFNLKLQITKFQSLDDLLITLTKTQYPVEKLYYTLEVSLHDNNFISSFNQDKYLTTKDVFNFHLNLSNGIIIAFEIEDKVNIRSSLSYLFANSSSSSKISLENTSSLAKTLTEESSKLLGKTDKEILFKLKSCIANQVLPNLRIISSPLHKYQYVKRIKSNVYLPIEDIVRRVYCNAQAETNQPEVQSRKSKQRHKDVLINKSRHQKYFFTEKTNHFKWNISLPTGLTIKAIPILDPKRFYIKQKYVIPRKDFKILQEELYRCFLPNGILMKFMKNGSVITYHYNKSINVYKYGYFEPDNPCEKIPVKHRLQRKLSKVSACRKDNYNFESKIRRLCNKYRRRDAYIPDSVHLQSRRFDRRDFRKVYHLSKRLYNDQKYLYPLINTRQITSNGTRYTVRNNLVCEEEGRYREILHSDYLANETTVYREDGTLWYLDMNGKATTQFIDGTRITTWGEVVSENIVEEIEVPYSESASFLGEQGLEDEYDRYYNDYMNEVKIQITKDNQNITTTTYKDCYIDSDDQEILNRATESLSTNNFSQERTITPEETPKPSINISDTLQTKLEKTSPWVLLDLNYMFEHPNFATVTFNSVRKSAAIILPDQAEMHINKNGSYKIVTPQQDNIDIDQERIKITKSCCIHCGICCFCILNISPFITKEYKKEVFLYAKDSYNKKYRVDFRGRSYTEEGNVSQRKCGIQSQAVTNRVFVLRRNLSGLEYFSGVPKSHIVHCLQDFDDANNFTAEEILSEYNKMKIMKKLKCTFSNHFVMPYQRPSLETTNSGICNDKIWDFKDMNFNTFKVQETIMFYIYRNLYQIKNFQKEILDHGLLQHFLPSEPSSEGEEFIEDEEIMRQLGEYVESYSLFGELSTPAEKLTKISSQTLIDYYYNIIKNERIPKYFEILKGQMFCMVSKCAEEAMTISDGKENVNYIREILHETVTKMPSSISIGNSEAGRNIKKILDEIVTNLPSTTSIEYSAAESDTRGNFSETNMNSEVESYTGGILSGTSTNLSRSTSVGKSEVGSDKSKIFNETVSLPRSISDRRSDGESDRTKTLNETTVSTSRSTSVGKSQTESDKRRTLNETTVSSSRNASTQISKTGSDRGKAFNETSKKRSTSTSVKESQVGSDRSKILNKTTTSLETCISTDNSYTESDKTKILNKATITLPSNKSSGNIKVRTDTRVMLNDTTMNLLCSTCSIKSQTECDRKKTLNDATVSLPRSISTGNFKNNNDTKVIVKEKNDLSTTVSK